MYVEFKDKVVLVTGGSSGIGASTALSFAQEKAIVLIAARDPTKGKLIVDKIESQGGRAEFVATDLSKRDEINNLFDYIEKKYKQLDYAINNAGIEGVPFTNIQDYPEAIWDDVIEVNLTAVWFCLKREISLMLKASAGAVVNVASIAGLQASLTGGSAYTASKHGLIGLTKSAALENAGNGIRVNAVCPAIILTELAEKILGDKVQQYAKLHPIGRLGKPSEVADAILWLCSEKASFVTAIALPVDGGIIG